jgi:hypothetical protein
MQITRVGSRRVVQLGACCAIVMGLIGEQSAGSSIFATTMSQHCRQWLCVAWHATQLLPCMFRGGDAAAAVAASGRACSDFMLGGSELHGSFEAFIHCLTAASTKASSLLNLCGHICL